MKDIYQGDPKLFLTDDGADINVKGGQPEMEQGIENNFFISLLTAAGWHGNHYIREQEEQYGSDFEETARGTITLQKLNQVRTSSINALKQSLYGEIKSDVTNPSSNRIDVEIELAPPLQDLQRLILSRNGTNWIKQAEGGISGS